MTAKEMFDEILADPGVSEETKAQLKTLAANDQIAGVKLSARAKAEYEAVAQEKDALAALLDGKDERGQPTGFRAWYQQNWPAIQAQTTALAQYRERYGDLAAEAKSSPASVTKDDLEALRRDLLAQTGSVVPQVSGVFGAAQKLMWKHMKSGRETDFDLEAISKIATERHGGNLQSAYEEWDRPEAEKAAKRAMDEQVEKRVREEIAKRESARAFPGAAEGSASADTSPLSRGLRVVEGQAKPDDVEARRRSMINALVGVEDGAA